MQSNEMILFNKLGLSKVGNFNYSEGVNAFIGNAYTSMAGNTYLNEIRLLEGILIKEDVGHGHTHTFINGIRVFDLRTKNLLCERSYHCTFKSDAFLKSEVNSMLTHLLIESSRKEGIIINISDVKRHIEKLVHDAFNTDQRQVLLNQSKLFLKA
jgi:hypothetical protein